MKTITMHIPDNLFKLAKESKIDIEKIILSSLVDELIKRRTIEGIIQKSKLTEKDVEEIGDIIKSSMAERYGLNAKASS